MWRIMQRKRGRRREGVNMLNEEGVASVDLFSTMECQDDGFLALVG